MADEKLYRSLCMDMYTGYCALGNLCRGWGQQWTQRTRELLEGVYRRVRLCSDDYASLYTCVYA